MSGDRKQVDRIVPKERRKVAPTGHLVWASVLVSGGCCNTLSYTYCLKTIQTYYFMVLEA